MKRTLEEGRGKELESESESEWKEGKEKQQDMYVAYYQRLAQKVHPRSWSLGSSCPDSEAVNGAPSLIPRIYFFLP